MSIEVVLIVVIFLLLGLTGIIAAYAGWKDYLHQKERTAMATVYEADKLKIAEAFALKEKDLTEKNAKMFQTFSEKMKEMNDSYNQKMAELMDTPTPEPGSPFPNGSLENDLAMWEKEQKQLRQQRAKAEAEL